MRSARHLRGFTLLEVMVALVIISLALAGVAGSMGQMIDTANTMRDRTYASWIAQNKITELRLSGILPEVGETSGEEDYANTTWIWSAEVSETGVENLLKVDVTVSYAGFDEPVVDLAELRGYRYHTGVTRSKPTRTPRTEKAAAQYARPCKAPNVSNTNAHEICRLNQLLS